MDVLEKDVSNLIDDGPVFLPFGERVTKANIDCDDFMDVPEYLGNEVFPPVLWDDVSR